MKMQFDAVIIGGGASGLMCAVAAKLKNSKLNIAIIEKNDRVGKKLLSTGNGRCNLTNKNVAVNKYKGIRCGLCSNEFMAKMSRQHNDANVLAFGARVVGKGVALGMVDAFFEEEFLGGRHAERVGDLTKLEEEHFKA